MANAPEVVMGRVGASLAAILLILLSASPTHAVDRFWSIRTWQIPDGSNNSITGLAQSPDGYLWIGTTAGLNQFDGVHFEHHALGGPLGLADSRVRMLLSSRSGGLWVVFDGSVVFLKLNARPTVFQGNVPSGRAQSIAEDRDGAVWIGYRSGRICQIKNGKVIQLSGDSGIPTS